MCDLIKKYEGKTFTGYKVVARYKGSKGLYSIAMGTKYPNDGKIREAKIQNRLFTYFHNDILTDSLTFRKNMVGRTAAFEDKSNAIKLYDRITFSSKENPTLEGEKGKFNTEVWEVCLSKDLLAGTYGIDRVVAGRHIKFLNKIMISYK